MCKDLKALIFTATWLWGSGKFDLTLSKCRSLRLGTPSNLKVLDSMRLCNKYLVWS